MGALLSFGAAAPLSDYVGAYAYGPGQTIELVVGDQLFAVLDRAEYKLSPAGQIFSLIPVGKNALPSRRHKQSNWL